METHEIGRFLRPERQRIGQDEPPFRIGVVDLDRLPVRAVRISPGRKALPATAFSTAGIRTRRRSGRPCHDHVRKAQTLAAPPMSFFIRPIDAPGLRFSPRCRNTRPCRPASGGGPRPRSCRSAAGPRRWRGRRCGSAAGWPSAGLSPGHLTVGAEIGRKRAHGMFQLPRAHVLAGVLIRSRVRSTPSGAISRACIAGRSR
jgi:hypothetical protein